MPGGGTCYSKEGEPEKDAAPKPKPITLVKPTSPEQVLLQATPEASNGTIKENDVAQAPPMPEVVVKLPQENPAPTKVKPQPRLP